MTENLIVNCSSLKHFWNIDDCSLLNHLELFLETSLNPPKVTLKIPWDPLEAPLNFTFSKTFVTLLKSLWIEWNTLENTSKCPLLKNLEASFQLSNPLKLSWNYLKTIFFERTLKRSWQAWNFFERCLKHPLITLDPSLKCHWNILETPSKLPGNTIELPWNTI